MRYLKIRAKNYNEAMMKLKMEHGDDAIPISHKYVKEGGLFNSKMFARDVVELTAAVQDKKYPMRRSMANKNNIDYTVDDKIDVNRKATDSAGDKSKSPKRDLDIENISRSIDDANNNLNKLKTDNKPEIAASPVRKAESCDEHNSRNDDKENNTIMKNFETEFNEIKQVLHKLVSDKKFTSENDIAERVSDNTALNYFIELLKNNDYDTEQRNTIVNEVKNSMSRDDLKDKYKIEKNLKDLLKCRIVTTGPLKIGSKKKIMMFVGPTGVGKTTTVAKLGAIHSLRESNNVAFVTIDNYRIAATEQLKKYAEIMRIPLHVVNNQKEFKEVLAHEKAEIIMVDTSGRSHRNDLKISEIKNFADLVEYDFEKILCVSANTKKNDLIEVFKAFNVMDFDSVVITKVDETSYIGNVVDIADKYNKPISYVTNGQEVPNDIIIADPDKIVDMMIGNVNK